MVGGGKDKNCFLRIKGLGLRDKKCEGGDQRNHSACSIHSPEIKHHGEQMRIPSCETESQNNPFYYILYPGDRI